MRTEIMQITKAFAMGGFVIAQVIYAVLIVGTFRLGIFDLSDAAHILAIMKYVVPVSMFDRFWSSLFGEHDLAMMAAICVANAIPYAAIGFVVGHLVFSARSKKP